MFEGYLVTGIAIAALVHSSLVSILFFLFSNLFLYSMILDQQYRWLYGKIIVVINLLIVFGFSWWKIAKTDDMITSTTDQKVFRKEIGFYESLGFSLSYNSSLLSP